MRQPRVHSGGKRRPAGDAREVVKEVCEMLWKLLMQIVQLIVRLIMEWLRRRKGRKGR